ncbi:Uncharacterized conserved protein [Rathayibacter oskolensis]|uniref:Uncharacterized conserved protein n=1 Tax=Rathayibacter oskolensis TaxID=1891671 RepID=A0A1X7N4D1_9MICO|nr:YciI family protein [Rathayibacter oskolensis]SMH32232.1 Uncharacterized conserved protein [Rathayibacter oskolensis]
MPVRAAEGPALGKDLLALVATAVTSTVPTIGAGIVHDTIVGRYLAVAGRPGFTVARNAVEYLLESRPLSLFAIDRGHQLAVVVVIALVLGLLGRCERGRTIPRETQMQYMILIHTEPFEAPAPGGPGFDEYMAPWLGYYQTLVDDGVLVTSGQLVDADSATTIRRAYGGGDTVVDGPFAETKEQFGGFYIVDVADLDAALAYAAALPLPAGSFEVRPLLRTGG